MCVCVYKVQLRKLKKKIVLVIPLYGTIKLTSNIICFTGKTNYQTLYIYDTNINEQNYNF